MVYTFSTAVPHTAIGLLLLPLFARLGIVDTFPATVAAMAVVSTPIGIGTLATLFSTSTILQGSPSMTILRPSFREPSLAGLITTMLCRPCSTTRRCNLYILVIKINVYPRFRSIIPPLPALLPCLCPIVRTFNSKAGLHNLYIVKRV